MSTGAPPPPPFSLSGAGAESSPPAGGPPRPPPLPRLGAAPPRPAAEGPSSERTEVFFAHGESDMIFCRSFTLHSVYDLEFQKSAAVRRSALEASKARRCFMISLVYQCDVAYALMRAASRLYRRLLNCLPGQQAS